MTIMGLIILLVIAGICGAIGRAIAGGTHGGCLVSVVLGFIGAFVGSWLARTFHFPALFVVSAGGEHFPVVWSILGAALVVALFHLVSRR